MGTRTITSTQANTQVEVSTRIPVRRGPYTKGSGGRGRGSGRPSDALAENLRAYRMLRQMTQDQLAARMGELGHGWGRSTVSAAEGRSRNVTIDELFGLAVTLGVTIGQLLNPAGPDHSRRLCLDVGLDGHGDNPHPVAPELAHLWAASRAVIRFRYDDCNAVAVELADELPPATQRELDGLRAAGPVTAILG